MIARDLGRTTGDKTARFGFRGTDLGYFTLTNHGYVLATFGDTFDGNTPGTGGWRSPVILRTSNRDLDNGVKWDNAVGGARAKQVLNYRHGSPQEAWRNPEVPVTIIPNDIVHLPDGRFLMSTFMVRSWDRHGDYSWVTWCNRFFQSTEKHAENWGPTDWKDLPGNGPVQFNNDGGGWGKFQNASFVLDGKYLYMFGTESGRKTGGGIYLARVPWEQWDRLWSWQFWGWDGRKWVWGNNVPTPILNPVSPLGTIGEINVQKIGKAFVLAYVDSALGFVTRTAVAPDSVWTAPQLHAPHFQFPAQYAPSVHPYSAMGRPYAHLSQWHKKSETDVLYTSRFLKLDPLRDPEKGDNFIDLAGAGVGKIAEIVSNGATDMISGIRAQLEKAGIRIP